MVHNLPALLPARMEFALTAIFHYFFVPLSLGLIFLVLVLEACFVVRKGIAWRQAAEFWGKFFLLAWAVGGITGFILRWELINIWDNYSSVVHDVLDVLFTFEAIIGPLMLLLIAGFALGWNRINQRVHFLITACLATLLVLQSSAILTVNAWMQHPVGVVYRHGRINIASLGEILMNPMAADAIVHVLSAACVTGCVFALFVCSWYGLRRLYQTLVEHTFKIAAILGGISSILLIYSGHMSARDVAELQPMKFAAFEAIWHSEKAPASLVAFAVPDQVSKVNRYEVKIPYLLSFLTYGELEHSPPGLLDIAADDDAANEGPFVLDRLPNVPLLFSAFHLMVFCGVSLLVIFACVFLSQARNRLISVRKLQLLIMLCSPMPWLAASAGWLVKEAGRQPWSVYRILPTAQSLTLQVPSTKYGLWLMIALAALVLLGTFFVICLYLVRKGPGVLSDADHVPVAQTLELSCIVQEG